MTDVVFITVSDASLRATGFVAVVAFEAVLILLGGVVLLGLANWAWKQIGGPS
jgi:hypothetical protein